MLSLSELEQEYIKQSINTPDYKEVFISYGRAESLAFAARFHQRIRREGFNKSTRKETLDVWFDKVNIPHGDDYQQRINNGIENAQNFVFIISSYSLRSKYCLFEIAHAIKCGKRIIPVFYSGFTYRTCKRRLQQTLNDKTETKNLPKRLKIASIVYKV